MSLLTGTNLIMKKGRRWPQKMLQESLGFLGEENLVVWNAKIRGGKHTNLPRRMMVISFEQSSIDVWIIKPRCRRYHCCFPCPWLLCTLYFFLHRSQGMRLKYRWWKVNKKAVSMNLLSPLLLCCNMMMNIIISCPHTSMCVRQTVWMYNSMDDEGKWRQK